MVVRFDLEWDGDNVKSIAANYMGESVQYAFKYDSKNNPYYNLFEIVNTVENGFMPYMSLSKNNVTDIAMTMSEEGESYTYNTVLTYTYNKKDYPASKVVDETEEDYRYQQTLYYEYK